MLDFLHRPASLDTRAAASETYADKESENLLGTLTQGSYLAGMNMEETLRKAAQGSDRSILQLSKRGA